MSASPLAGLLVVDLSRFLPGPYAARLLRDLGARVIKVEEPELGDPVRRAPPLVEGQGALAARLLGGVESLALDLKKRPAIEALDRLLARADVLLETFRPGTLARLGLDPEELRRRRPRLVVCSLSGWGQSGPQAGRAGHDLNYQALAGTLASTAAMPNLPAADLLGAWSAVSAILAALLERERTGEGARIDASLYEAALEANLAGWAAEAAGPRRVGEALPLTGALPCYNLYPTADGRLVAFGPLEARFWRRFCRAVRRLDLLPLQHRDSEPARRKLAALFRTRTRGEWEDLFVEHDLPAEPVLSPAEALGHPQAAARGLEAETGGAPRPAFPALIDGERPRSAARLPAVGEDTGRLVEEFELADAALSPRRLRSAGIGPRPGWRKFLWRLASASRGTAH